MNAHPCSCAPGDDEREDGEYYYSVTWALSIVRNLREKHARGLLLFQGLFLVDTRQLASCLARRDPIWPQIRYTVKLLENWEKKGVDWKDNYTDVKTLRGLLHRMGYERLSGRLDRLYFETENKRAQEQGEGGGA